MGSDRARVSYDPARHWRAVISQQGRVALEADANEATSIAVASARAQLLDVIGPAGAALAAPGDPGGYNVTAISATGTFTGDLSISAGAVYVGGERAVLDVPVTYSAQPDWLDSAGDRLWVAAAPPTGGNGSEIVYLLLRDQEVSAVEDPALREVALGGPDTSARLRLVQRIVRQPTAQGSASAPFADPDLLSTWASLGLSLDPATMRLHSAARLQVQGNYVGAENQLIRVQIASVDPAGNPTLVWGFDNASALYRVTPDPTGDPSRATTLTLIDAPVDVYHQPVAGQTVELLESAAQLSPTDTSGHIAATAGTVTTLTATGGYQPDSGRVILSTSIAVPGPNSPPLYLRVWQGTAVLSGGSATLGDTGLQVTLSLAPAGQGAPVPTYHVGDYWTFAVRPGTSAPIYPARIAQSPQPPEGPSLWAFPLAFVQWASGKPTVTDCRPRFDNLVDTLAALISNDRQGKNFPLALLRLFGRGVVSGLIPSITVTPPASGANSVQVTVSVTGGTVIDGRGAVIATTNLTDQDTVPLSFSGPGQLVDTKRWLYLITDASETPSLQIRDTGPVGGLSLPQDVIDSINNPAGGPVVPATDTAAQAETDAWQMYTDVPAVDSTITDPAVCLGVIGVQGAAGWTAPDDRQQLFPTPAITAANWQRQRQHVYDAVKSASVAAPVNLHAILVAPNNLNLNGSALLGGTVGRRATVQLDGPVRGSAVTVRFQSSAGVTVHGPVAIAPGSSSAPVTFDITAASGGETITAIIDGSPPLQASFTAVQVGTPALAGGATAVMSGDPINVSLALSSPASEALTVTLQGGANVTFPSGPVTIQPGTAAGQATLTVVPPASGHVVVSATVKTADNLSGASPPSLQFTAVALGSTIAINPSPITAGQQGTATVQLAGGPTPYGIDLAITVDNTSIVTLGPTPTTVAGGQSAIPTFQLNGVAAGTANVIATRTAGGSVRQTVSTSVTVAPAKAKEGKDTAKDGKDTAKDHKDGGKDVGKENGDKVGGKETLAEKTHVDLPNVLLPLSDPADAEPASESLDPGNGDAEPPQGRAFVRPALRPEVGRGAFDAPDGGGRA